MNLKNRWIWLGAIALGVIIFLSFFSAPSSSRLRQGSTYSRSPDGYGAWFADMQTQGTPIQRWQKPIEQLLQPHLPAATEAARPPGHPQTPLTLIRIDSGMGLGVTDESWIREGNILVLLGVRASVTEAPFRSKLTSSVGSVQIETSRRFSAERAAQSEMQSREIQPLLGDRHGAVVWQTRLGKGRIIFSSTPFLAANAYQDAPGNFKFLAKLVTEPSYPIWVDEYMHGYREPEANPEAAPSLIRYLAQTPLLLVAIQAIVLLLMWVWGQRRLGAPIDPIEPLTNNSEAYIQALASVLQKANSSDFVVETIAKAERLQLQRSLGLGSELLDLEAIGTAWQQQTGRPAAELRLLDPAQFKHRPSEQELLTWVRHLQSLHLSSL